MTKLTKQEIEKEREEFEGHIKLSMPNFCRIGGLDRNGHGYISLRVDTWFYRWIKNAELAKGK